MNETIPGEKWRRKDNDEHLTEAVSFVKHLVFVVELFHDVQF